MRFYNLNHLLLFLKKIFQSKTKVSQISKNKLAKVRQQKIVWWLAVFPGISRSGSTICAGLLCKKDKSQVAKFSFLMSIPIIFLSLIMEIFEICTGNMILNLRIFPTIISFLIAFIVGIFAIKLMIKLTVKSNLKWFSVYLFLLSILTIFI